MENIIKTLFNIYFLLFSSSAFSNDEIKMVIDLYSKAVQSVNEVTMPRANDCIVPFRPPSPNGVGLTDLIPRSWEKSNIELTGKELVEYLKERVEQSNYEGRDNKVRCSIEIEKKGDNFDIVLKSGNASVKTYPVNIDVLNSLTPSEESRLRINSSKKYVIQRTYSKKVATNEDPDNLLLGYELNVERIQTENGYPLFYSKTSPNFPGQHVFEESFFSCHFKAALY
tara:strand:- start:56230 stop:56907 length:678 start_codon:yes stop_codon:yes gene_type:complete